MELMRLEQISQDFLSPSTFLFTNFTQLLSLERFRDLEPTTLVSLKAGTDLWMLWQKRRVGKKHTHTSPLQSPELRSSGEEPQLFRCPVVSTVSDPPLQPLAILVEWLPLTVHKGWLPHNLALQLLTIGWYGWGSRL